MEKLQVSTPPFLLKAYLMLTKPGIILGNSITAIAGFALASRGHFNFCLLFAMLEGLSLIIASACVFNNYIDQNADKKMVRTQNRALPKGIITPKAALVYATLLGFFGVFILAKLTNLLTLVVALAGFFIYVGVYSFLKYRTAHGTLVGSIAGAIPPVVGYTAVTGHLDIASFIIFMTIVMWQMPHFFAIAVYRLDDYVAASIPVLPIKKGMKTVKIQIVLYIVAYTIFSVSFTFYGLTGVTYLIISLLVGFTWLVLGIRGFIAQNDQRWARQMFIFSLIAVMTLSTVMLFSVC